MSGERCPSWQGPGISVEFIDARSLKPLDVDTIAASARKTRRLLVVEHGHYTAGFGAHVVAEVVQLVRGVKVRRLAFPDVPGPGSAEMMTWLRSRRSQDRRRSDSDRAFLETRWGGGEKEPTSPGICVTSPESRGEPSQS